MGITFILTVVLIVLISLKEEKDNEKGIDLNKNLFKTNASYNTPAFIKLIITAALYAIFW